MTARQAIALVKRHNRWRRGAEIPMEDPKTLGLALDLVISLAQTACPPSKRTHPCNLVGCTNRVSGHPFCPKCSAKPRRPTP